MRRHFARVWMLAAAALGVACSDVGQHAPSGSGGGGAVAAGGVGASGRSGAGARSASGAGGAASAGASGRASGGNSGSVGAGGNGGVSGSAGLSGVGGSAGIGSGVCKRGIAANVTPSAAFLPSVSFWYNWSLAPDAPNAALEFVPMVWDENTVDGVVPNGARYLLGFNEPNFKAQANLSAEEAASLWVHLENSAQTAQIPLVSPAVNFCGPAANCNGTSPYDYLKAFFAACPNCAVDYIAVHWYNCDLPSLRDYLELGGGLEGFEQFGKPIWLTEFACAIGSDTSVAAQEAYMRAALPYLDGNPHVFRYAWFSADPIPNAKLMNSDGSPTALGLVYRDLPSNCR